MAIKVRQDLHMDNPVQAQRGVSAQSRRKPARPSPTGLTHG